MRLKIIVLGCLLPFLAAAGQDQLKYLDYQVTRVQAEAAGAKLAVVGRALDVYLASDAAKRFDSDATESGEDLPPEVFAILARAGIDWENLGESNDTALVSALGYAVFKVCDGENAALLQLRKAWTARAFDIGYLGLSTDEKTQFSQAVVAQGRTEVLPVAQAYVDSWLAIAAVKVGCAPQAMRYADFALADSTNPLADGVLGMTRSGLLLNAAKKSAAQIEVALAARSKAMAELRRGGEAYARFAVNAGLVATKAEFKEGYLDIFESYDTEFTRTLAVSQTPVWRVKADVLAKVTETRRNLCGNGAWMTAFYAAFMTPEWPTALAVLHAKGQDEVVAAYELADWFNTENKLSGFNNHLSVFGNVQEDKELVWQAYGKAETKAEFERAADAITLSAPENGLAIVKIFGHEFLLASGERNSRKAWDSTRWYTLQEIQAKFRDSSAFKALTSGE